MNIPDGAEPEFLAISVQGDDIVFDFPKGVMALGRGQALDLAVALVGAALHVSDDPEAVFLGFISRLGAVVREYIQQRDN